jgi:hypothetical protein
LAAATPKPTVMPKKKGWAPSAIAAVQARRQAKATELAVSEPEDEKSFHNGSIELQERDFILCHLEKHGSLPVGARLEHNKSFQGVITWKGKKHNFKMN